MVQLYCHVTNGQVVEGPRILPGSFDGVPESEVIKAGWYPAHVVKPDEFRDETEAWNDHQFEIGVNAVMVTMTKRDKTVDEIEAVAAERVAIDEMESQNYDKALKILADGVATGKLDKDRIVSKIDKHLEDQAKGE